MGIYEVESGKSGEGDGVESEGQVGGVNTTATEALHSTTLWSSSVFGVETLFYLSLRV